MSVSGGRVVLLCVGWDSYYYGAMRPMTPKTHSYGGNVGTWCPVADWATLNKGFALAVEPNRERLYHLEFRLTEGQGSLHGDVVWVQENGRVTGNDHGKI